jgi:hypothetical protein
MQATQDGCARSAATRKILIWIRRAAHSVRIIILTTYSQCVRIGRAIHLFASGARDRSMRRRIFMRHSSALRGKGHGGKRCPIAAANLRRPRLRAWPPTTAAGRAHEQHFHRAEEHDMSTQFAESLETGAALCRKRPPAAPWRPQIPRRRLARRTGWKGYASLPTQAMKRGAASTAIRWTTGSGQKPL